MFRRRRDAAVAGRIADGGESLQHIRRNGHCRRRNAAAALERRGEIAIKETLEFIRARCLSCRDVVLFVRVFPELEQLPAAVR